MMRKNLSDLPNVIFDEIVKYLSSSEIIKLLNKRIVTKINWLIIKQPIQTILNLNINNIICTYAKPEHVALCNSYINKSKLKYLYNLSLFHS